MNKFIKAAQRRVYKNGVQVTYSAVTEGVYDPSTSSVTNSNVDTVITSYPKNIKANNFNYPNLVGKQVKEFLIVATDLASKPEPQDLITIGSEVFTVNSVSETIGAGEPVLYKALAVK